MTSPHPAFPGPRLEVLPGPRGRPGETTLHGFGEIREAVADNALEVIDDATGLAASRSISCGSVAQGGGGAAPVING